MGAPVPDSTDIAIRQDNSDSIALRPGTLDDLNIPKSLVFYHRKYKLTVYTALGVPFAGNKQNAIEITSDLRINFSVNKNILQPYQFSEITILNLSATTESNILANGLSVALEAGYQNGPYGVIFKGTIVQAIRGKDDSATYFLHLVCVDGDGPLNLGIASLAVSEGTAYRELIQQIARSSTVPFEIAIDEGIGTEKIQRGYSYQGSPVNPIRDFARSNNAGFYFDNGTAYISKLGKPPSGNVPELNSQTGLIGMPQQTDQGIKFRTLINTNLTLGDFVHINNRSIILNQTEIGTPQVPLLDRDGLYRIIGMVITGDTRGNDWYYDCEAVNQTNNLPEMIADPSQTVF